MFSDILGNFFFHASVFVETFLYGSTALDPSGLGEVFNCRI